MFQHLKLRNTVITLAVALASGALVAQTAGSSGGTSGGSSTGSGAATQPDSSVGGSSMGRGSTRRGTDPAAADTGNRAGTLDNMPATGAGQGDARSGTNATGTDHERAKKSKRSHPKRRSGDTDPADPHQLNTPSDTGTGGSTGSGAGAR